MTDTGGMGVYRHPTPGDRPTRDATCMAVAEVIAQRSTCSRASVGVVVAYEGRLLATGYNGAPAGLPHCEHTCGCGVDDPQVGNQHHLPNCPARLENGCKVAVHAEVNAIAFAAKHGMALQGSTLYTTLTPCLACAQLIINAGIVRVVAETPYHDMAGLRLLIQAGLQVA